jgi:hypothetical protein
MAHLKNFQVARNKNKNSTDLTLKNKSYNKGLSKYDRMLKGIAIWCSFYRANPHRFVEEYLGIQLKMFQVILFYMMHHVNYFMYLASRGQGKTFLVSIYCAVRCILYPETKIVVASKTMKQSREIVEKLEDLRINSPNLAREIKDLRTSINDSYITFHNGSWIKTVAGSENARGRRANAIVIDEFRMVDEDVINKVLRKFLTAPRSPKFLTKEKYKNYPQERNKELYMSSCWLKAHWSWQKVKAYFESMYKGRDYFMCSLPYQLAIKESLLSKEQVEDEMSEADFSEIAWKMEMQALYYGESEKAYFKIREMQDCRREIKCMYPHTAIDTVSKKNNPNKKRENEIRLLGVDVALMASNKHDNDNTSIIMMRLIPEGSSYIRQVVYLESCSGENTEELAIRIKRLFYGFECDYCVLDAGGNNRCPLIW